MAFVKKDKSEDLGASVDAAFDSAPTPAAPGPQGGLVARLRELAASSDPNRHNRACDALLDFVGDDEVRIAFNAIPRYL